MEHRQVAPQQPPARHGSTRRERAAATAAGLGAPLGEGESEGDALSLVGRAGAAAGVAVDLVGELGDRFAVGDFTGTLRVAELVLGQDPEHSLAQHYARCCRDKLDALYTSRLLVGGTVPELSVAESELRWLGLDPHVALVLAHVDGSLDVDAVIAGSGLPRLDALRALVELLAGRVIRLV